MVALVAAGLDPQSEAISKGLKYLKKSQLKCGGFSYLFMPANTASASWVMQSLSALGKDPSDWRKDKTNLPDHLLGFQSSDGSFALDGRFPGQPFADDGLCSPGAAR